MAIRSLIVRIGADTQSIDKALATVGESSKRLADGLKKLGDTPLGKQTQQDLERQQKTIEAVRAGYQRLASDAVNAAKGIQAIGGPTRLTSRDLDGMAKTVRDGLDAFRALGQQAPKELQKVSAAIQAQQKALQAALTPPKIAAPSLPGGAAAGGKGLIAGLFGDVGAEIASVAAGVATGQALLSGLKATVEAVVGAVQGSVQLASQLDDLSKSTNVGVEALQELGFAGKRVGLDLNTVADLVSTLSKRIGTGDAGATAAIQSLGLNLDELKKLAPDRLFTVLAEGVAHLQDPLDQAAIGSELFGKQFQAALRLANDGLDSTREAARAAGAVLGADSIRTLDAFGDKVGDIGTVLKVMTAEALTPFIEQLGQLLLIGQRLEKQRFISPEAEADFRRQREAFERANKASQNVEKARTTGSELPASPTNPFGGPKINIAADARAALGASTAVATHADVIGARLNALRISALQPLTAKQKEQIQSLSEWGESEQEIARLVGTSVQAVHRYKEEIDKAKAEGKAFTAAMVELDSATGGFGATLASVDGNVVEAVKFYLDAGVSQKALADAYKLTNVQIKAIATSREVDSKILALNTTATVANANVLGNLGRIETDEIARLKESEAARLALNSAMVIPDAVVQNLRNLGAIDIETIRHLKELTEWRGRLNDMERAARNAQAFGLDLANVGFKVEPLPPDVILRLAKAQKHATELDQALDLVGKDFVQLAQIGGGAFSVIVQSIGGAIVGVGTLRDSLKVLKTAETDLGKAIGFLGAAGAALSIGQGLAAALESAFDNASLHASMRRFSKDLGVNVSEDLAKSIREAATQLSSERGGIFSSAGTQDFSRAAELSHLTDVFAAAGGIEIFGIDKAITQVRDLFAELDAGRLSIAQVGKSFDEVFGQLAPLAINKTTGLVSKQFVELQQLSIAKGVKSPAVEQFRGAQIQNNVLGGLTTFLGAGSGAVEKQAALQKQLKDLQDELARASVSDQARIRTEIAKTTKELDTQNAVLRVTTVQSQGAATALGSSVAAAFAELQREGTPVLDIINQLDPVIGQVTQQLDRAGFGGGEAFDTIRHFAELAKDEIAGPALQGIAGLGQTLAGLSNTGLLTETTFSGLADQVGVTFQELVSQGKSGDDILKLMQPTLQTIFELQQRTGFTVDRTTQGLLDQAKAQGIVGDQFKSTGQQTVDALDKLNGTLEAIATAFGVTLPDAAKAGADGVAGALDGIDTSGLGSLDDPTIADGLNTSLTNAAKQGGGDLSSALDDIKGRLLQFPSADGGVGLLSGALRDGAAAGGDMTGAIDRLVGQFKADLPGSTDPFDQSLSDLRDKISIGIPGDTRQAVGDVNSALRGILDPSVTIHVSWDIPPFPGVPGGVPGAFTGGLVTPTGIQHLVDGGRVLPFLRRGTDSVPAMLTPGEIVINAAQQGRLASALSGGLQTLIVQVVTPDGRIIKEEIINDIVRDKRGVGTILKRVVA